MVMNKGVKNIIIIIIINKILLFFSYRFRIRLVVKKYIQTCKIDYEKTSSFVPKMNILHSNLF